MPVRKSKRTKAQARAKAIHPWDIDFGHLWRQLVRVGWTSKKPTGLSNTWSYFSPDAKTNPHVEGVNMFIGVHDVFIFNYDFSNTFSYRLEGEIAVVRYAIAEGIISANADSYAVTIPEQPNEPEAPVEPEKPALPALPEEPESVTAFQIDTTVALSANTIEGVFGPDSEDDGKYTQQNGDSNTENEERVSQIDTSVALSASTIDDVPREELSVDEEEVARVLFGSMGRSDQSAPATEPDSPSNTERVVAAADPSTQRIADGNDALLPQRLNTEDVNILKDDDNADDYESIGSEAEGAGSSDDECIERKDIVDKMSSDEEEMSLMDEAFIDC
ncbi:unnamed protein product [Phytophthora lilii]|uniref:Unnamed protein product n=1 Tax=Phytophthora lilii TaxID=2077276 RepID=A0A9W6X3M0_9STRA|nr:unnamed protein product [Phytophthora lilii]